MSLVPELMHIIGLMLPLSSVTALMRVNRMWYRVLNTNRMWRDLYRRDFPLDPSERSLEYKDATEELFLHSEEIHYETLYRLTYITYPYLKAGQEELSRILKELYERIGDCETITCVNSAQEQRQQRIALHGQEQAEFETYTEGYSHYSQWRIEFIHCTHPLIWTSDERLVQRDNKYYDEHVGYKPINDLQELIFTMIYYPTDNRYYFYIHHIAFENEIEQVPVTLKTSVGVEASTLVCMENIKHYMDSFLAQGYVPVSEHHTMTAKQMRDYNILLDPINDE